MFGNGSILTDHKSILTKWDGIEWVRGMRGKQPAYFSCQFWTISFSVFCNMTSYMTELQTFLSTTGTNFSDFITTNQAIVCCQLWGSVKSSHGSPSGCCTWPLMPMRTAVLTGFFWLQFSPYKKKITSSGPLTQVIVWKPKLPQPL